MSQVLTNDFNYIKIAEALREKLDTKNTYYPADMPAAIRHIVETPVLLDAEITENGRYTALGKYEGFSQLKINVQPRMDRRFLYQNGEYIAENEGLEAYSEVIVRTANEKTVELEQDNQTLILPPDGDNLILKYKKIVENGQYSAHTHDNIDSYSVIDVDVPLTSELIASSAFTTNVGGNFAAPVGYGYSLAIIEDNSQLNPFLVKTLTEYTNNNVSSIKDGCFASCLNLRSVTFEKCEQIGSHAFEGCVILSQASFPKCRLMSSLAFYNCSYLEQISLPECYIIYNSAFENCFRLSQVYLLSSVVVHIANSNVFKNTPIEQSRFYEAFGSVYVPESLVTLYKNAQHWSYYSDRIVAYNGG